MVKPKEDESTASTTAIPFDPALDVMPNPPRVPISRNIIPVEKHEASKLDVDPKLMVFGSQKFATITYDKKKFTNFSAPVRINWPIQVYKPKGEMRGTPEQELIEAIQKIMDTSQNGGLSVAVEMPDPDVLASFKSMNERLYGLFTKHQAEWKWNSYHWLMLHKQISGDEDAKETYRIAKETNTASEVPTDENISFTYALRTKISHTTQWYLSEADWKQNKRCSLRHLPEFSNTDLMLVFNLASIYTQELKGRTASPRIPALAFVKIGETQGQEQPDLVSPALRKRKHGEMTPAAPPNTPTIVPTVTASQEALDDLSLPPPLLKEPQDPKKSPQEMTTTKKITAAVVKESNSKEKKEEEEVEEETATEAPQEEERDKKRTKSSSAQLKGFRN
jgi:hypothetical protein